MTTNKPISIKRLNEIIRHATSQKDATINTEFTEPQDIAQLMRYGFSLRAEGDVNDIQITSGHICLDEEINALNVQSGCFTVTDQNKNLYQGDLPKEYLPFNKGAKYSISGYFGSNINPQFHNEEYTEQKLRLPRPFQNTEIVDYKVTKTL